MELRLGARAVARLHPRVAKTQMRLAVARILAHDALERGDERGARQLARGDLRDARGHLAPILRIRAAHCGLRIADCGLRSPQL